MVQKRLPRCVPHVYLPCVVRYTVWGYRSHCVLDVTDHSFQYLRFHPSPDTFRHYHGSGSVRSLRYRRFFWLHSYSYSLIYGTFLHRYRPVPAAALNVALHVLVDCRLVPLPLRGPLAGRLPTTGAYTTPAPLHDLTGFTMRLRIRWTHRLGYGSR